MKACWLMLFVCQLLLCSSASLNVASTQHDSPVPEENYREPAFAIEFTLDHLVSSVSLANGSTHSLARVHGGAAYQSLMRQYLEICHQVSLTQDSDSPLQEMREALIDGQERERVRRAPYMPRDPPIVLGYLSLWFGVRSPKYSAPPAIYDGDEYTDDTEVAVLSEAVGGLKDVMRHEMSHQFNVTGPLPWAYANIIVPDFFWTTIKPKPDPEIQPDGLVSWIDNFDHDSIWFQYLLRKFSTALYRNKFRRSDYADWEDILHSSASFDGITPASDQISSYTKKQHCIQTINGSNDAALYCGAKTLSSTNVLVAFNNASLSLWLEGPYTYWTPWNTFPELGSHEQISSSSVNDPHVHWDLVVDKIYALCESISSSQYPMVDMVLSGESWTQEALTTFWKSLRSDAKVRNASIYNIIYQPDLDTATKIAARWGREYLEASGQGCLV